MLVQRCELVFASLRSRFRSDTGSILAWNNGRLPYVRAKSRCMRAKSSLQPRTTTHNRAFVHSHALSCALVHHSARGARLRMAAGVYIETKVVLMLRLR